MFVELLDCKNKGISVDDIVAIAAPFDGNGLAIVLHDTRDQDFCTIGNAAVVVSVKPV